MGHVFHAACEGDVVSASHDCTRKGSNGCHCTGAPTVNGIAGNSIGEPGQKGCRTADIHALIAGLGGRGYGDIINLFGGKVGVST